MNSPFRKIRPLVHQFEENKTELNAEDRKIIAKGSYYEEIAGSAGWSHLLDEMESMGNTALSEVRRLARGSFPRDTDREILRAVHQWSSIEESLENLQAHIIETISLKKQLIENLRESGAAEGLIAQLELETQLTQE